MKDKEKISVFICYKDGKTACICMRSRRRCNNPYCETAVVERDNYDGWRKFSRQDRYGKQSGKV